VKSKVEFDTTAVCDPTALLAHRINFTPILTKRAAGKNRLFTYDISRNIALHRTEVLIPYERNINYKTVTNIHIMPIYNANILFN